MCHHAGLTEGKPLVIMPGPRLKERLKKVIADLGPYPHQAMLLHPKVAVNRQTTVKLVCSFCGDVTQALYRLWSTDVCL